MVPLGTEDGLPVPAPDSGSGEPPLQHPYPEYVTCPECGEPEVEVWCYEGGVRCHACGAWIPHLPGDCRDQPSWLGG